MSDQSATIVTVTRDSSAVNELQLKYEEEEERKEGGKDEGAGAINAGSHSTISCDAPSRVIQPASRLSAKKYASINIMRF